MAFTVGADDGHGHKVAMILGESQVATVYTTDDKQLRWKYHQNGGAIPAPMIPARQRFDTLMAEISAAVPIDRKPAAYAQLGKALFNALEMNDAAKINESFKSVEDFILKVCGQRARFLYVRAFLLAAAVLIGIGASITYLPLLDVVLKCTVGVVFGVVGACMSVLQRSSSAEVDITAGETLAAIQGAARALVGALFGLFVVLASIGDLVLGTAKANITALAALAVVAGISERFVPEIIKKIEGGS